MELTFSAPVFEWRGPAPFHFVALPPDEADALAGVMRAVTYGWGMVPATVTIGATTFTTSLWPRQGGFVLPLKNAVRAAEGIELDDVVTVTLVVDV